MSNETYRSPISFAPAPEVGDACTPPPDWNIYSSLALRRLSPLLLLAAALVALAGLFVHDAPPASAQSATPVWEATFTPEQSTTPISVLGCFLGRTITSAVPCDDKLTDNEFTVGGETYSFTQIVLYPNTEILEVVLDAVPNAELQSLYFCVGPNAFRIDPDKLIVNTSGFAAGWTDGEPVSLSIGEHCSRPIADSSLTLSTNQSDNRFTEGGSIVITGKLDDGPVSVATAYRASVQGRTIYRSSFVSLGRSTAGLGRIAAGEDTFRVRVHDHNDNVPIMNETISVIVEVDQDRDGTFSLAQTIPITIVDDENCSIRITAGNTTPAEGREIRLTFEHGGTYTGETLIEVITTGTARRLHNWWVNGKAEGRDLYSLGLDGVAPEEWRAWDYSIEPSFQVSVHNHLHRLVQDRPISRLSPGGNPRTLSLKTRQDNIADDGETVNIIAEGLNHTGCRGTLTLTIRDAGGRQNSPGDNSGTAPGNSPPEESPGTGGDLGVLPPPSSGDEPEQATQDAYADLISKMYEWRNDARYVGDKVHTDRWDRTLMTFGETVADTTLTPMTASEAQGYADRGWSRWEDVAEALRELEAAAQQPTVAPVDQTPPEEPSTVPEERDPPPNSAPTVVSQLHDVTGLQEGATREVSLSGVFSDADNDDLTVTAVSDDGAVATATAASDGSALTVAGVSAGEATITVSARDPDGDEAVLFFDVFVTAPASEAESTPSELETQETETSDIVDRYDTNGDGSIDLSELNPAMDDFRARKITYSEFVEVYKAWQASFA